MLGIGCRVGRGTVADAAATDETPEVGVAIVDGTTSAFQPASPFTYVAKVKDVLVGLPPTDDEVAQVATEPAQLKPLITAWMRLPQYRAKMKRFFQLASAATAQGRALPMRSGRPPSAVSIGL